jgi:hypothetical protein
MWNSGGAPLPFWEISLRQKGRISHCPSAEIAYSFFKTKFKYIPLQMEVQGSMSC